MFDRNARVVFDQAAGAYDEARPSYPLELIDKLIELTQLPANARILEIGCGTGQITVPLAERDYEIVAVELGENLARIAVSNLKSYHRVRVIHSAFEEWERADKVFDLVVSAQAFHWIDPVIGYPKIRRLLKDQGYLAVVYNLFQGNQTPLYRELDAIYRSYFPQHAPHASPRTLQENVERTIRSIRESGLFQDPLVYQYPWVETYTTNRYMKLLDTFSDHRALKDETRTLMYQEIRDIIDKHGGTIDRPLLATLFLAQVA